MLSWNASYGKDSDLEPISVTAYILNLHSAYLCFMGLTQEAIRELLFEKSDQYNKSGFIQDDPISIPHMFTDKEDIEISGFLAASIAWGQRSVILKNAEKLMKWMDHAPFDFIKNATESDIMYFNNFKHRTFNGEDCIYFMNALQNIYLKDGGLDKVFSNSWRDAREDAAVAIHNFRSKFFSLSDPGRTSKHVADPLKGSAAKRINMFLRWMVRRDNNGVDFGIWKDISMSSLCCPLDLHSGNVARGLGILKRNANDWPSVMELTSYLKTLDPDDPVRFDFGLFGLGIYEGLRK